jgi:hypothetical protein
MRALVVALLCTGSLMGTGCVMPELVPEARGDFKATGSIERGPLGASFNSARVLSPSINLGKHTDGSWSGQFSQGRGGLTEPIDVSVTDSSIRGVRFTMTRARPATGREVYDGSFNGKQFHFELSADGLAVHTTHYSATYGTVKLGKTRSEFGEGGALVLTGDAADVTAPPWPQMAFAMLASFY